MLFFIFAGKHSFPGYDVILTESSLPSEIDVLYGSNKDIKKIQQFLECFSKNLSAWFLRGTFFLPIGL